MPLQSTKQSVVSDTPPDAPIIGSVHLDDGSNTEHGGPSFIICTDDGPPVVWEELGPFFIDEATTTDATETTVASVATDPTSDNGYIFNVSVVAVDATNNKTNAYVLDFAAHNYGAGAVLGTVQNTYTDEEDADWSIDVDVSANTVRVRVTGEAGVTINWKARVSVLAVS